MKKITLQDIANELGISKGTVDRAIHNRSDINPKTKQKVLELVNKYNYKPDKVARSLSLKSKKIKIGVVLQKIPEFFWDNVRNGINAAENELTDFGLQVIYKELNTVRKHEDIVSKMEQLIKEGVNAIAVVPSDHEAVREIILEAYEKGIYTATFNDDIYDSKRIFYVGPQMRQSGRIAAELIGKILKFDGKVATINGGIESLEYKERLKGFYEVLRERYPKIEVIANCTYNYERRGKADDNVIRAVLESDGINGVYNVDGASLASIGEILSESRRAREITLIGHEIWGKVKDLIEAEVVDACISQDPYSQGYFIIKMLFDFLYEGKILEFDRMYTRLDIVMKENLIKQNNVINPYYISL